MHRTRSDSILGQFRETERCRDANFLHGVTGRGLLCFAPQIVKL